MAKPRKLLRRLARRLLLTITQPAVSVLAPILEQALAQNHRASDIAPVSTNVAERRSSAVTRGIRVTVQAAYQSDQSSPESKRYVFAYTVEIQNQGTEPAQLRTRHWIITHGNGRVEEVKGPGVIGKTPRLLPGESFRYTSGCILETEVGTMHGSYRMYPDGDQEPFDAVIAPFSLVASDSDRDPERLLN